MPFRSLALAAAALVLLAGCAAPGSSGTPSPAPTDDAGPRTLRTLIDSAPESPELRLGAETAGNGFRTVGASYLSEGLTITGVVYLPEGPGPFPGVVLVHGAVDPATFSTGSALVREQEALATSGHIVFAPDLRGYAGSDPDPSGGIDLNVGATADVVNAGRALAASGIPSLDPERIGLLGHSLGGGQSLGAMVVAPDVYAVVATMAPVSSRTWWVVDHFVPRDSPEFAAIAALHGTYEDDPEHWDDVSPATFADRASVPLLVLYGTADDPVYAIWEQHTVDDWRAAGADVTLIAVDGAGHQLDPRWEDAFGQILTFLDGHLAS